MRAWTAEERFWSLVRPTFGCWEWRGLHTKKGYAVLGRKGNMLAYRFAYELLVGPFPPGTEADHLCVNPGCVSPYHIEPVTHRVNVLRGDTLPGINARKTHCPRGHAYDEANTRHLRGRRFCRACMRLHSAKYQAAKRLLIPPQKRGRPRKKVAV